MKAIGSKIIQASAGTGKTFALSGHFLKLLLLKEDPSSILASTFTKKAASEILERIYLRLASAVKDPNAARLLESQLGLDKLDQKVLNQALQTLIEQQDRLKILTLDSFSSLIARFFFEELNLPQDWRVQEDFEYNIQLSSAVAAVCSSIDSIDLSNLIIALKKGSTSRSISASIRSVVGDLLEIFQESEFKAWDWIKAKKLPADLSTKILDDLKSFEIPKTKTGTPNKKFADALEKLFLLIEAKDWDNLIKQTLIQNSITEGSFSSVKIPENMRERLIEIGELGAAHLLNRLKNANHSAYGLLYAVFMELQQLEEKEGLLSFDRVIRRIVTLGKSIFSDELYFRLDSKIHHILLDEFQDTSLIQWRFLEPLIEEKLSALNESKSFFCVGDGKQAIYGWRGGDSRIFDSIPIRWNYLEVETREVSYRSQSAVIETVNKVFSSLSANPTLDEYRPAIVNWMKRYKIHSSAANLNSKLSSNVSFELIASEKDSGDYSAAFFERLKNISKINRGCSIAILVRNNEEISQLLDLARNNGLELSTQGGTPLDRFSVITSLLALFELFENPGDTVKQFEFANAFWLEDQALDTFISESKQNVSNLGLAKTIQIITSKKLHLCSYSEVRAIEQLSVLAVRYEVANQSSSISGFIRMAKSSSVQNQSSSTIQVLTMHKSKGLEFDIVMIPYLDWEFRSKQHDNYLIERDKTDLHPIKVSLYENQFLRAFSSELNQMAEQKKISDFEESLSLLYVALTRAKTQLYLFSPENALKSKSISAASIIADVIQTKPIDLITTASESFEIEDHSSDLITECKETVKETFRINSHKMRGLARVSPSSFFENYSAQTSNQISNEFFGSQIHKLFSLTPWIDECLDDPELFRALKDLSSSDEEIKQSIAAFRKYLTLECVKEVMTKPDKAGLKDSELYLEKPFVYREGNSLVQGRMDRLFVGKTAGQVFDFKVGKSPDADSRELTGYLKQLKAYKKAAAILFPKVSFSAKLIFLGNSQVIET